MFASASAASLFAAGGANTLIYLTRGYETTTATTIFDEDDLLNFSDRIIASRLDDSKNGNQITDVSTTFMNQTTGYRESASMNGAYVGDGSMYLHVGYINSGYVGASETVQNVILNNNLVLGRMAIENQHTVSGSVETTANMATTITAGSEDYYIEFSFNGTSENLFFRGSRGTTLTLDSNIKVTNTSTASIFNMGSGSENHIVIGSQQNKRTVKVDNTGITSRFLYQGNANATFTAYADITINSNFSNQVFLASGKLTLHGDLTMNGGTGAGTNWLIAQDNARPNSEMISYGNITVNGGVNELFRITGKGIFGHETDATKRGTITINSNVTKSGFYLVNHETSPNASLVVNSNIHIKQTSNVKGDNFYLAGTFMAGQSIVINGDVTIDNYKTASNQTQVLGRVASGSHFSYNGAIISSRTDETSWNLGSAANKAIGSFGGSKSNSFRSLGLRNGVVNLLKTGSANAIAYNGSGDDAFLGLGGDMILNVFGQNQLDLSNVELALWGAAIYDGRLTSATINLNGTSLTLKSFNDNKNGISSENFISDGRSINLDFGMGRNGMTAEQAADYIAGQTINETGAGISQTFTLTGTKIQVATKHSSEAEGKMNHIYIKNYVVGEDHVICGVKLSEKNSESGNALFSGNVDKDLFVFEGFGEYGVDYYVSETSVSGGWEYAVVLIPEAAEMAVLFGLAALGFAAYRRRK